MNLDSNVPVKYGASYKSITALVANTPEAVFAPGSNVNGAIVWTASAVSRAGGSSNISYVAKTSAPATVVDGDVIASANSFSQNVSNDSGLSLSRPVFISAGKGLYAISTVSESSGSRSVLYTLL